MMSWQELADKSKKKEEPELRDAEDEEESEAQEQGGQQRESEVNMEEGVGDEEFGKRIVRKLHDPKLPSENEVKEHYLSGHLPFRSWCPHCVKGRGKEMEHKKQDEEQTGIPEYHLDYCFPGDEHGERLTVLVVIERYTKMKRAIVVPSKGSTGNYAARMVLDLIHECGDKNREVIVKSDQEAAIKNLVDEVDREKALHGGGRWVVDHSPVGASASNGFVERAIQFVQGQIRVLKLALEKRWNMDIPTRHAVIAWIVEYSAFLLNR